MTFILNLVHRPELVPEYSATLQKNKSDGTVENLDIFKTQQRLAHEAHLKTTIQMTYASLFNAEAVALAKHDAEVYHDEIGLSLLGLPCPQFTKKYHTKDFCIWMFESEKKKQIISDVFEKFYEQFGFYPSSTGSYYLDAESIRFIKEKYPSVICAVATCFEEGPKAYHTCNNSWFTLFDGGPWAPWIPSTYNTHVPASDESDDSGIVAIPHLSRDLMACFDGNGSNFGTHPQNVLRGMIYDSHTWEYPYLYNLIDQYRHQAKFNRDEAYNMMFVGPGWMNKMGRWEAPYELLLKSYRDAMQYYGSLKQEGCLVDMTMEEYAKHYRKTHTYTSSECALWQDILYGSSKQHFWYVDNKKRLCIDMNQGGAIIDLRPYAAQFERPVGIQTSSIQDASYPYLIQANYRAGYFTHYAGEGTIKSCRICYQGESVDLCLTRTHAHVTCKENKKIVVLDPVEIAFQDVTVTVQTRYELVEGSNKVDIYRCFLSSTKKDTEITIQEYITASYGYTEYPERMEGILLHLQNTKETKTISYNYQCRKETLQHPTNISATIPQIRTKLSIHTEHADTGNIQEGYAFSPVFTLQTEKTLQVNKEVHSWLSLEKAH